MSLIEMIVNIFSRFVFGKAYLDGFCDEPSEKDSYELSSLFPNEKAMQIVDAYISKTN